MHKHFINLSIVTFLIVGCTVRSLPVPQSQMTQLSTLLQTLDTHTSQQESTKLSRDIFQKTAALSTEFKLTSPPLWHNTLVNVGLREKGLCYHWSDALYAHLVVKDYPSFEFHLVGANIGEYFWEHNALVVVSKRGKVESGVLIDPWRDSGKLYFSKLKDDKKYTWAHRLDRECKPTR